MTISKQKAIPAFQVVCVCVCVCVCTSACVCVWIRDVAGDGFMGCCEKSPSWRHREELPLSACLPQVHTQTYTPGPPTKVRWVPLQAYLAKTNKQMKTKLKANRRGGIDSYRHSVTEPHIPEAMWQRWREEQTNPSFCIPILIIFPQSCVYGFHTIQIKISASFM